MSIRYEPLSKIYLDYNFLLLLSVLSGEPPTKRIDFDKMWGQYENSDKEIWIAINSEDDTVVGTASIIMEYKMSRGGCWVGHIEDVIVLPPYQKMGIGHALVQKCLMVSRRYMDCYKVILNCSEKNIPFYEKIGFQKNEIEMRKNIYELI